MAAGFFPLLCPDSALLHALGIYGPSVGLSTHARPPLSRWIQNSRFQTGLQKVPSTNHSLKIKIQCKDSETKILSINKQSHRQNYSTADVKKEKNPYFQNNYDV